MKIPRDYRLSEAENEAIFQRRVKPRLFKQCKSVKSPVAIIFGGQPGAGKSKAVELAELELKYQSGAALIVGDDLRPFHPNHDYLMKLDDSTAALFTQHDAGRWVEKALNYAKNLRCNIILESTMRVPDNVIRTIQELKSFDYKIEARALAVNERLSWQGVLQRYENQRFYRGSGRMTLPEFHEAAYLGMLESLNRIETEKLADKVTIYKRGIVVIYENELQNGEWKNEPLARISVENERNRPWTLQERVDYAKNFDTLIKLITKPERNATQAEIDAIISLQKEAYAQISSTPDKTIHTRDFSEGIKPSLEMLQEGIQLAQHFGLKETLEGQVKSWSKIQLSGVDYSHVLIAQKQEDVNQLNTNAYKAMLAMKHIKNIKWSISTPYGWRDIAQNVRIRFDKDFPEKEIKADTLGIITAVKHNTISVKLDNEREITFKQHEYGAIDYGYALTFEQAKGKLIEAPHVLIDKKIDIKALIPLCENGNDIKCYWQQAEFSDFASVKKHLDFELEKSKNTARPMFEAKQNMRFDPNFEPNCET